jgi:hypothetical protein
MRYINLFAIAIAFASGCQTTYKPVEVKLSDAETREIFKNERLGEELYYQDVVAAKTSRMLTEATGPIKPGVLSGWIVVKDGVKHLTRFIKQTGEDINVIYDVRIDTKGNGDVTKDNLRPLSKTEIAMFRARQLALKAASKDCAQAYNTAVMEDIDSDNWLVYVLAATDKDVIVVGGHSRVKVSPDGSKVLSVTPLYQSCLMLPMPQSVTNPQDVPLSVDYPGGNVPTEIFVYLNRLHGFPFSVTTPRGGWLVKDGKISLIRPVAKTEP